MQSTIHFNVNARFGNRRNGVYYDTCENQSFPKGQTVKIHHIQTLNIEKFNNPSENVSLIH